MNPGDKLLLYTDGIETGDEPENRRGLKRLVAAAAENRHLPVDEWVARLALELFSHDGQTDDLTLLGLEISAD
jgi:serine phosphatase RsbU (regulator of sigma subunit)